jgi:hypothetical protein
MDESDAMGGAAAEGADVDGTAAGMTSAPDSGKGAAPGESAKDAGEPMRHIYGPRPVSAILPALVRPAFRKRSPSVAQLLLDWHLVVGPAIGAVTTPRKLFGGTLTIVASGPIAMELQHLSEVLIERINTHLGRVAVSRLRFMQDVATANTPLPPLPPREAVAAAGAAVEGLPPGGLRDALESLGRVVLVPRS